MKLSLFACLLLAIIYFAASKEFIATTDVNVRAAPCTTAEKVGLAKKGESVTSTGKNVDGCGYSWMQISKPLQGYVAVNFFTESPASPVVPTPGAGINVLLVGDSHTVGTFGRTLDSKLRSHYGADKVATFGRAGMRVSSYLYGNQATSMGWLNYLPDGTRKIGSSSEKEMTPLLSGLLSKYKPKLTIVALGANEISLAASTIKSQVEAVTSQIASVGSKCAWVLPPQTRCDATSCPYSPAKLHAYYNAIIPVLEQKGCKPFKSDATTRSYLDYGKLMVTAGVNGDGIHFDALGKTGRTALQQWAQDAFDAIGK